MKFLFDIDTPSVVGLVAGALTSTPGLAVAIDSTNSPLASIAYGIAYPFGVIGVILFVKLLPRVLGINLEQEARKLESERRSKYPELQTCIFKVTNDNVFDRTLAQLNVGRMTGAVVSRVKSGNQILMRMPTNKWQKTLAAGKQYAEQDSTSLYLLQVTDCRLAGEPMPVDYAREAIDKIILSQRRVAFLQQQRKQLYDEAVKFGKVKFNIE